MGAGGHWENLFQKFRLSCAGLDKRRIQDAEKKRQEEVEFIDQEDPQAETSSERGLIADEGSEPGVYDPDLSLEVPAKVSSGGAVSKEELGRATWILLHTLAAQFPETPTKQQQRDVKELMSILSRLYPCKTCADHFKEVLKTHAVRAKSGLELTEWMCQAHNVVNKSLGKPEFPCERVYVRWGNFDCDAACNFHARPLHK